MSGSSYKRLALTLAGLHFIAVILALVGMFAAILIIGTYKDGPNIIGDIFGFILYSLVFPTWFLVEWVCQILNSPAGMWIVPVHSLVFGLVVAGIIQYLRNRRSRVEETMET